MEQWLRLARELGFDEAAALDPKALEPMEAVREMCAADKCRAFGKNWTCPPACGTLAECRERMHGFSRGILVQTVGRMEKAVDTRAYRQTEARHRQLLAELFRALQASEPNALCLGAGGCRVCGVCAYPEPCRFPEQAMSSMEAYGLFVTQVCRTCNLPYYHGERTITYTACVLF